MDIKHIKPYEREYYNINKLAPKWPFVLTVVGRSGSGKTNMVIDFIISFLHFDTFHLYAKDLGEPYYTLLQEVFDDDQIQNEIESYFSSDPKDIVDVDELDRDKQNLFLFDDFVTEKDQKKICDLAIRGRKMNVSIIYITQDYYRVPKTIRLQCNYISIFPSCDGNDVSLIFREKGLNKKIKEYFYNNLNGHDCLTVDFKSPDIMYRRNFTPINELCSQKKSK